MTSNNEDVFSNVMEKYFETKNKIGITKEEEQIVINEQIPDNLTSTRMSADGNIKTIDELGELISNLLNSAWGSDWGRFSSDIITGTDSEKIIKPLITYSTNLREISTGTNIKPKQTETIKKVVEGSNIGDTFIVYRQFFDCIVEFDFYHNTLRDTKELMNRFEEVMLTFTGCLKKSGVKEICFLKEIPAISSFNYVDSIPMTCLHYFVQLERNNIVRVSTIRKIEEKIYLESTLASEKQSDVIQNNITYKGDI